MSDQLHNEGNAQESPTVFSGVAARWSSLDDAAALIGTKGETLRLFARGVGGRPVLASREIDGRTCVQPGAAYAHLRQHAPRCRGLIEPAGFGAQTSASPTESLLMHPEVKKLLEGKSLQEIDLNEFLLKLGCSNVPEERVRVITQAARAIQNDRSIDLRAGKSFAPDDVTKMLRAHADLVVEAIDESAAAFATQLLKWLATNAGTSLAEKLPDAQPRIENEIREHYGNAIIAKIRAKVENQVRGVRDLEFTQ